MGDESDFNHPVKIVWRDLLRQHLRKPEAERKGLSEFILQYENLYGDILKNEIQA